MIDKATWRKVYEDNTDFFDFLKTASAVVILFTIWALPCWGLGELTNAYTEISQGGIATIVIIFAVGWALFVWLTLLYIDARRNMIKEAKRRLTDGL